jgi:hypothetical protein
MLRDPEHERLFLIEMPAGEGRRMSKNGLSEKNTLSTRFLSIPGKVSELMSEPECSTIIQMLYGIIR